MTRFDRDYALHRWENEGGKFFFGYTTTAAWDEWAPQIQNSAPTQPYGNRVYTECPSGGGCEHPEAHARYWIDHGNGDESSLRYRHSRDQFTGRPQLQIENLKTHPDHRNDGVAEALIRRLHADHPDMPISPGSMTQDGWAFHNRMMDKDPEVKKFVTAESLLVGPQDAYDETDWFARHYRNPPNEDMTDKTWYHVSPHQMPVGTVLQPMHGETPWNDDPYDHGLQNRAEWIWVEHDKDKAKAWMHWVLDHQPNCYIYRVEPNLGPFAWNGTADEGWVTDRATVVEFLDQLSRDLQFQEKH